MIRMVPLLGTGNGNCIMYIGNSPVYLKKAHMKSSYFSYDLSLRYSWVYLSPVVNPLYTWENSKNKFGFGF